MTGSSQELTLLVAEVSLPRRDWEKHPIVTGPGAPCILGVDFLQKGCFKDLKGYKWAFGVAAVGFIGIDQLSVSSILLDDPFIVGLPKVDAHKCRCPHAYKPNH